MNRLKKKLSVPAMLACMLLIAACSDNSAMSLEKDEKALVKIMYWNEQMFFQEYGNLFNVKFPNVEIEVVSSQPLYGFNLEKPKKTLEQMIEEEKPDILLLNNDQYKDLAEKDALLDLEPMLAEKDFNGDGLLPAITALLREKGGGKLYGLTPSFYSQSVFYNKDLFDKYGIEVPRDKMSWKELYDLARRFPTNGVGENRVFGFAMNNGDVYSIGDTIGSTEGLVYTSTEGKKIAVNTEGWKNVYRIAIDAIQSGAVYIPGMEPQSNQNYNDYFSQDAFLSGKAAMTLSSSYYFNQLEGAKNMVKNFKPFNWGLVTEPIGTSEPDIGSSFGTSDIFAINANSPNAKAAWELVKYMHGDEAAKMVSRTAKGTLMTRTAYIRDIEGHSMAPFYALKPRLNAAQRFVNVPVTFFEPFSALSRTELQQVVYGKKSLDDALKAIETAGQLELEKAQLADKAAKEKEGSTESAGSQ